MNIKKGDNVIIVSGKDRGKTGKVTRAIPKDGKIVVEGLNMFKRRQRPKSEGQKGQMVEVAMPIQISNVMLVCPKTGKRTRIGSKEKGGKFVRVSKKSGEELP
jgi:large subunit ribosomal protein L24